MSRQRSQRTPAIVLGGGESALGAIRSLRRAGIPVAYSKQKDNFAAWSRVDVRLDAWPSKALEAPALGEWLDATGLTSGVLMPCSDQWVESVAQLRSSISDRFRTWTPGPEVIQVMVDKNRFRSVLEELDLPHPRSFLLTRNVDEWRVPDDILNSAFLKPHDSLSFFREFGVKGIFVSSRDEAFEKARLAWDKGLEFLVQEYIPGPAQNHFFVDGFRSSDGKTTQYLARQRLRMHPPDFGNSTSMKTVALESVSPALRTLDTLFAHTKFHGIFSAEFKLDQRSGTLKIIEVNCRPWWFVDYADRCGLRTCEAAYLDALGQIVPSQQPYELNKLGTYPIYDWEAFRNGDQRGLGSFSRMIFGWLRSYQPVFSWSDPMPVIAQLSRLVANAIGRRVRRIFGGR